MKKIDIKDFHMEECYITLPYNIKNNNLVSKMFHLIINKNKDFIYMKEKFSNEIIFGIKKDINSKISTEYYFYKKEYNIDDIFIIIGIKGLNHISKMNYFGYTIVFEENSLIVKDINICDKDKAYIINGEGEIRRKNIYFTFKTNQKKAIIDCLKNTIYPFKNYEIIKVLKWIKYQREDGSVIIGKKIKSETLYFTRISYDGFILFCKEYDWYDLFSIFLNENSHIIKYYVFDLSVEYTYKNGKIIILKTSFYSLL